MRRHLRYASYVVRHKWFVFRAGLRTGAPLWRLVVHDWSKLSPVEWGPYARRFGAGRSGVLDKAAEFPDFHVAWTHHWHRNPHHWEHWLRFEDDGSTSPMLMPEHFAREMVADWLGAGRAITGRWGVREWYATNRSRIVLHAETRVLVEFLVADTGATFSS